MLSLQERINEAANNYNKTKDKKYKDLWYKLVEDNYGSYNIKRWSVPTDSSHKTDDGWNSVDRRS